MRKLGFLIGVLLFLLGSSAIASHTVDFQWMGYCCGQKDCLNVSVTVVQFGQVDTIVLVHNTVLSLPASVVKESEDGHTYWCRYNEGVFFTRENTRCVFYTVGG